MKSAILPNFLVFTALLMLALVAPAKAGVLGRDTPGTVPSGGLRADFSRGSRFTLSETATVIFLCANVDGQGGGGSSQSIRLALYRDASGVPGAKVGESTQEDVVAGTGQRWFCLLTPNLLVGPGDYWIMLQSGANAGVVRYYYDGPANWYGGADAFADGAADTFGPGGPGNGTLSLFASYNATPTLGRITAGSMPSGGLRADVSRGSKFRLTELSTIKELCAYLDGKGGGSGSQSVRLVVYRDANGVPGAKVVQSVSQAIAAGTNATWVCRATPYTLLRPGDYWIMIHSGSNATVARYYSDGPANWYGGTDAWADDAATLFGPGGTGNGTLSVYAKFADVYYGGYMSVGATPSGGLRADYRRGSGFNKEKGRAVALSVYMDGLGGGTGSSQQVAFALYDNYGSEYDDGLPSPLTFVTKPITIPAGMPPQWIDVPVPPYAMWVPGYGLPAWVVIHSGGNAGIARYYYDGNGTDNYCGHPDLFSDGTDQRFGTCEPGNGVISAFLTYETGLFENAAIAGNQADPAVATPSNGLSANFMRGSKFTVTDEGASLGSIHAYLDGLGGGAGSQQVQALVYDDSPEHKLVMQTQINTITAGTQPDWRIFQPKEPVRMPPGNYYLMLFTSGNAGVARNYSTPAVNWIGASANFTAAPPATLNLPPTVGNGAVLIYADLVLAVPEWPD